ncbi:MAG: methyltransferase domain-containing protein [Candidatus ainarchaeum sp.]|nr:methyltransferase domain-containing protein [Candidatus ainarchaeum sp.]
MNKVQKLLSQIFLKIKKFYHSFFYDYTFELKKVLKNCNSVLDVGCGKSSPVQFLSGKCYLVGVDSFKISINKSKNKNIHNKYYVMNVMNINKKFKDNSFDCVVALDLIEHLEKKDGEKLIKMMEKIARKKIVIFTPNGFLEQKVYDNNQFQKHKSGWTVSEMRKKGYDVIGIGGYKKLRGEFAQIKYSPKTFWGLISNLSQKIFKNFPKYSFQILCIKIKK